MPKQTKFHRELEDVLRKPAWEVSLYNWVIAQKDILPGVQIKYSIGRFMEHYNIGEDRWPLETALQAFYNYDEFGTNNQSNDKNNR